MENRKILYLECNSGISGDMTVAALLDLGADRGALEAGLASLPLSGYRTEITTVFKSGLQACDFNVILDQDNHDHDMAYLHGDNAEVHEHHHDHEHDHEHEHEHTHEHLHPHDHEHDHPHDHDHEHDHAHDHEHSHDHHHHDARNLQDITAIIEAGALTPGAKELALRIFRILAEAEAYVHGKSVDEIHFHEVGAIDSIVDIAAAAICLDNLHPDQVIISKLTDGMGQIRCQHGIIPVPVPAVTAVAAAHHLELSIRPIEGELVTPTGAAIAAAIRTSSRLPELFRIVKTGLGAGKRSYPTTGVLRAMILEELTGSDASDNQSVPGPGDAGLRDAGSVGEEPQLLKLETNIDDSTGEMLGFVLEELMYAGALDAYYTPVYMKKNRPAWLLSVLTTPAKRKEMERIIFRNTTTIGIRCFPAGRTALERTHSQVNTPWGPADVKCCTFEGETFVYPEYDSVARIARENQVPFKEVLNTILNLR